MRPCHAAMCDVLGIFAGNSLDKKKSSRKVKTVVGPRCSFRRGKKDAVCYFRLRWNRWNLADWGPEVPSIKDQNLRLKWHQNNDINKIGYQMFNPIPPSSWNLKTWREFCPHVCRGSNMPYLQAALWKGSAFGTHLLYIQHCCFFLQMEGRGSITIWDYRSKGFNLQKARLLLRHGAEDLQCLQTGKPKGRMLSLHS